MARPVRISYTKRDTIKIGDYESITPSWHEEWELDSEETPDKARKDLIERVEKMFRVVTKRALKQTIQRRVNVRDQETEEYMDEACDYFKVKQGVRGGRHHK